MKRKGFTGTQEGMTPKQKNVVRKLVKTSDEVHHGVCIGADAEFHGIARRVGAEIIGHPPTNTSKQAKLRGFANTRKPKQYLKRNADIVAETDELIATPKEYHNIPRGSGTWATIREAGRQGKPVTIIYPDGSVEKR